MTNMNELEFVNYVQINDMIATSGQLNDQQIKFISNQGYTTIINLAPHTAQDTLPEEGKIVASNFMTYINIPVLYEDPQIDQLKMFCAVMSTLAEQKVWIHCAKNTRVAAFVYLFQRYEQKVSHHEALSEMFKKWTPDDTWLEFFEEAETHFFSITRYKRRPQAMVA
ncbi:hypothetical protein MNBD_GAMMA12-1186 [hydrothermal vent metagenome]|uniref:DSP-PTPase phosphatase fused to NAD+ Kinase domain-containing protein n=1 Tax=hydrothermal vent metagenome TaxID=652676 RepID=A0A3B0YVJ5_9ZZZZ